MSVSTSPLTTESRPTTTISTSTISAGTISAGDSMCDQIVGVLPWLTPPRDDHSHDPRSAYVETFWLPVIGPSATLLMRRFADLFEDAPSGYEIDLRSVSRDIGLGPRLDKGGAFARTVERCIKFTLMYHDSAMLYVRQRVPRLGERQVQRLDPRLQELHSSWTIDPADDDSQRRTELVRAAHLVRTLLALGESAHDAERQLHRWHFHPSIAWHAVQWAQTDPAEVR